MDNNFEKSNIIYRIKTSIVLQIILCISLSFLVIIIFFIFNKIINIKKHHEYKIRDDIRLINSIENISTNDGELKISGYSFILNKDTDDNIISVFLRDVDNGNEIWFNMKQVQRPDVNSYFNCEYNYENTGFLASTKIDNLKKDHVYEIIINVDYTSNQKNRITVSSNNYILNNTLYSYNPIDFEDPTIDANSTILKDICTKGHLYLYEKDLGLYVYQYDNKLYWIAKDNFEFNKNGSTYIIYHLYTSQINKLPEKRINYKFDRLDFYFEDEELNDENISPYRVVVRDIPQDYAITYITTGVYDLEEDKQLWTKSFHLDNLFN